MGWRVAIAAVLLIVTIMAADGNSEVVMSDDEAASDAHGSCFFEGCEHVHEFNVYLSR